jgi:four helix bundle protein
LEIKRPNNKHQITKELMSKKGGEYDLEERTFLFARECRLLVRKLPKTIETVDDCKQLVRSSGSAAANYIEANEALSKKDFKYRIKICRKESKESILWLRLLSDMNLSQKTEIDSLIKEADELKKIFSTILKNSE